MCCLWGSQPFKRSRFTVAHSKIKLQPRAEENDGKCYGSELLGPARFEASNDVAMVNIPQNDAGHNHAKRPGNVHLQ